MGVVYLAEQFEPLRRDVAVKVIRAGMHSKNVIARFESERRTLALLDHPYIAQVFDAGVTSSGLPYFAMELAEGLPLTSYCERKQFGIRERIDLFIQVCQAIQYAHQKGIIHRDIKPSNVLVREIDGKPIPKVIDFGLAKALDDGTNAAHRVAAGMTSAGTIVGTLQYMSRSRLSWDVKISILAAMSIPSVCCSTNCCPVKLRSTLRSFRTTAI